MRQRIFKKMIVLILSVVMVASLFPVCVMAAGNTYLEATEITEISFNEIVDGSFSAFNTVDYYKFTLPSSGVVTIKTQIVSIHSLNLALYSGEDEDSKIFSGYFYSDDDDSQPTNRTDVSYLAAGTYYFKVKPGVTSSYGGDYNIAVNFKSSNESFNGTDNSFADANSVDFNKNYIGFLAENDTIDYYKFVLPSDMKVVIEATAYINILYYYLYNGDGEQVDYEYVYWDSVLERSNKKMTYNLTKGTYYFIVKYDVGYGSYEFSINADVPAPAQTGWIKSGSDWYYYDSVGKKVTGWQQIRGVWYFFNSEGIMQTGWVQSGKRWYYMNSEGAMVTGWKLVGGIWYYFNSDGVMQTGWVPDAGRWYYFNNDGAMQTGWKYIGGEYYYLKSDGTMAEKEYCGGYWLGSGGAWTYKYKASWKKDSTGWWYGDSNGWYAKNQSLKIDDKVYNFNARGYCTNP